MTGRPEVWASFSHDPRRAENASLRAADVDREVVHQALVEAYADGRLDRDEFDTRTSGTTAARTLGELPTLLDGLVPIAGTPALRDPSSLLSPADIEARAVQKWKEARRSAIGGFLTASIICWVIWSAVMFGGFPWPVFVMLGTGMNVVSTLSHRGSFVERERTRLEKKQRKEIERRSEPEDPA